ncbi:MAG TPA: hypothetical protein VF588_07845 [Pyrinomonadaceae bacterium]
MALLLTGSASAGIMQNGSPTPPPPPPPQPESAVQEPMDVEQAGIMGNDAPDSLTQIALDLLAVLPSLL